MSGSTWRKTPVCRPPVGRPADITFLRRNSRRNLAAVGLLAFVSLGLLWWFDPAKTCVPLCMFHAMTGLDCPGCGATRATHELLHGRLLMALHYNALWVALLPLAAYLTISEIRVRSGRRPLPGDLPRRVWFWTCISVAALAFAIARNWP